MKWVKLTIEGEFHYIFKGQFTFFDNWSRHLRQKLNSSPLNYKTTSTATLLNYQTANPPSRSNFFQRRHHSLQLQTNPPTANPDKPKPLPHQTTTMKFFILLAAILLTLLTTPAIVSASFMQSCSSPSVSPASKSSSEFPQLHSI